MLKKVDAGVVKVGEMVGPELEKLLLNPGAAVAGKPETVEAFVATGPLGGRL